MAMEGAEPRAVIDIGTNTALLLVGRRLSADRVEVIRDDSIITGLGRGAASARRLDPSAIERTLDALCRHRQHAQADGARTIVAVATEALRMVENSAQFLEPAQSILGTAVRIISGEEEAELSYLSVAQEEPIGTALRVVDVGGGSTELVLGEHTRIVAKRSFAVGSVRCTEQFVDHDPPATAEVAAIERAARTALTEFPVTPHPELHGVAGTVTTAAALLLGLEHYDRARVDRSRFSRAAVVRLRDNLARETLVQRTNRPCLPPGRADVIVAGLTILVAALDHCGADVLVVRDRGLRYALL